VISRKTVLIWTFYGNPCITAEIIAAMAITSFVFEWNDFMAAYLFKYDREKVDTTYNKALIVTSGLKG